MPALTADDEAVGLVGGHELPVVRLPEHGRRHVLRLVLWLHRSSCCGRETGQPGLARSMNSTRAPFPMPTPTQIKLMPRYLAEGQVKVLHLDGVRADAGRGGRTELRGDEGLGGAEKAREAQGSLHGWLAGCGGGGRACVRVGGGIRLRRGLFGVEEA